MMTIRTAVALISVAFLGTAYAASDDGHAHDHGPSTAKAMPHDMKASPAAGQATMAPRQGEKLMMADGQAAMTQGEIKRINKSAKKITIKHGEIKNLDMPPMTMVFQVADDAMLDAVKKGDKVMFHVEDKGGSMVITEIKPAK